MVQPGRKRTYLNRTREGNANFYAEGVYAVGDRRIYEDAGFSYNEAEAFVRGRMRANQGIGAAIIEDRIDNIAWSGLSKEDFLERNNLYYSTPEDVNILDYIRDYALGG